ncbi:hypothetical protein IV102_21865 [bacterium]|nr:hypothetical protein [bacterium]
MFGFTDSRGLLQKEVFDLAISDYTKALTLNQSDQIYFMRGMCHQRKLDAAKAKADFEAAVQAEPKQ